MTLCTKIQYSVFSFKNGGYRERKYKTIMYNIIIYYIYNIYNNYVKGLRLGGNIKTEY